MKAKLLKEHTHEGKKLAPGNVIELDQDTYEWLAELKVATYYVDVVPATTGYIAAVPEESADGESADVVASSEAPKKRFWGSPPVSDAPSEQV